ncbi:hypothetical protein KAX02_09495 [candidate division WOR-3 bacterium]|nr:hypothetical protein [candidate division WOR-3 bacterium]
MGELKRFWKLATDFDAPLENCKEEIEKFLLERYKNKSNSRMLKIYYALKPLLPWRLQISLRRRRAKFVQDSFPHWPIEEKLENLKRKVLKSSLKKDNNTPFIWFWPHEKKFTFVITHDVETQKGLANIERICEIEKKYGIKSSWNLVPERYSVDPGVLDKLIREGFEVGIHGFKHDGKLFNSRKIFDERMKKIEKYALEWDAVGFRSPATHRNHEWMRNIPFEYDSSFPDTDPYEPQPGGCLSIFPFFIGNLVELPITLAQDHTLFEILEYKDISIWKQKIDWIEKMNGMALVIVHPDYIEVSRKDSPGEISFAISRGKYPIKYYEELLRYVKNKSNCWYSLPRNVARWWRKRDKSEIRFNKNGKPYIEGPAAKDGAIAWAKLVNDRLVLSQV